MKVRHKDSGVEADVNDQHARRLLKNGWERVDDKSPAPDVRELPASAKAAQKRTRKRAAKKVETITADPVPATTET